MRYALLSVVVLLSALAIAAWLHSLSLGWDLLFDGRPLVGMFGATARVSAALSSLGAITFFWRRRRDSVGRRLLAAALALGALAVFVLVLLE